LSSQVGATGGDRTSIFFRAVGHAVPPGLLFAYFLFPPNPFNALSHRVAEPITNNYRYKLAKARLQRIGESPYKHDRRFPSFQRRDFTGR